MHFLAQLFQKLSSDRAKKSTFRMSENLMPFCGIVIQTGAVYGTEARSEVVVRRRVNLKDI